MTTFPATVREPIALPRSALAAAGGPTLPDILAILRRRMVTIIVLFLLFGALAVAGFYVWWRYYPGYRAEALIECVTNVPQENLSVAEVRLAEREHERFVQTQAYIVKNPEVLQLALQSADVQGTSWYKSLPSDRRLIELNEQLRSAPVRGTNYLSVSIETRDADDPHKIVNQVVDHYFNRVQDSSADRYRAELKTATDELSSVREQISSKRTQLKALAENLPGGVVSGMGSSSAREAVLYNQQVAQLQLELAQLEQLRNFYLSGGQISAEDAAAVEADPYVQTLSAALFQLQQRRDVAAGRYGARHTVMRQIDAQIASIQDSLERTRLQKLNEYRASVAAAVDTAFRNTQYALFVALDNLGKAEAAQKDQDRALYEYFVLRDDIAIMQQREIQLNEHVSNLQRLVTTKSGVVINRGQPATAPLTKSSPSLIMLPIFVFLALAFSAGVAIGLELLNTSVRTTQDVVRHLDAALLGVVPDTDDEEVRIDQVELAVVTHPRSMVAEAFRQIRANLQFSAPAARQRTVAVTSPSPEDGKTTAACNLAAVLAQGGRRVLLIDANLRRPMVHHHLKGVPAKGLSNILVGQATLAECVVTSAIPNLSIVGSGPLPPNPAELLSGEAFARLLEDAAGKFDQVILDAPPVLLASDASVIGGAVDGVILVVRANVNTRGAARRACSLLSSVGAHLFGVVLNAARVTRGGYFREQLRSYYDYQPEKPEALPPPAT